MWLLPASLPYMYGKFAGNKRQGWMIFGAMMTLFVVLLGVNYAAESAGNPAINAMGIDASQGSMEEKRSGSASHSRRCSPPLQRQPLPAV